MLRARLLSATFALALTSMLTACSASSAGKDEEDPDPGPPDAPADTGTRTSDTGHAPETDGPTDSSVDVAAPPVPTSVKGSAECKAWCDTLMSACGRTCAPEKDCEIRIGQCADSTKNFLQCQVDDGSWSCGADGYTIISSCKRDASVCPPGTIRGESSTDAGTSDSGTKSPYSVPKTCADARSGKGCCGWGTSPYDQIAYKCVSGKIVAEKCGVLGCVVDKSSGLAKCGDGTEYPATPNCFGP